MDQHDINDQDGQRRSKRRKTAANTPLTLTAEAALGRPREQSKFYTYLLELLAFVIHPGDTQSTTTICLSLRSKTLYLTNQGNSKFEECNDRDTIRSLLDKIQMALGKAPGKKQLTIPQNVRNGAEPWTSKYHDQSKSGSGILLDYYCACGRGSRPSTKKQENDFRGVLKRIYFKLFDNCVKTYNQSEYDNIYSAINTIVVVQNNTLFSDQPPARTGFHAESRIIRYFFVKKFPLDRVNEVAQLRVTISVKNIKKVIQDFRTYIQFENLIMGSSQGTCPHCKLCTKAYSACTGEQREGPDSPNWVHPLHVMPLEGSGQIQFQSSSLSHNAFYYLIENYPNPEKNWKSMKDKLERYLRGMEDEEGAATTQASNPAG
jgi:hypothetical protein